MGKFHIEPPLNEDSAHEVYSTVMSDVIKVSLPTFCKNFLRKFSAHLCQIC
jgi:hypothetical protein